MFRSQSEVDENQKYEFVSGETIQTVIITFYVKVNDAIQWISEITYVGNSNNKGNFKK
jgi:hypothetical protein